MNHPAITELFTIISINSTEERKKLLDQWIIDWLYYTEKSQTVVNKSVLTSEELDFVWYHIASLCGEDLIDSNITENSSSNTEFNCKLVALRSSNGKLKKNPESNKKARRS